MLTHDHHFRLEVFFRAVSLLDSFLSIVKVRLACDVEMGLERRGVL